MQWLASATVHAAVLAAAAVHAAVPPGYEVPCARRSLVAAGRPLASFARFATVAVDPGDAAQDGGRYYLLAFEDVCLRVLLHYTHTHTHTYYTY